MCLYGHQRGRSIVGSVSGELVGGEGLRWYDKRYTRHSQNPESALSTCGLITSMIFWVILCCRRMNNISPVDNISCRLYTCFITTRTLFLKKLLVVSFDFFFSTAKLAFPLSFSFSFKLMEANCRESKKVFNILDTIIRKIFYHLKVFCWF